MTPSTLPPLPPAKKFCPERGGEDPVPEVLPSAATRPDEAGISATFAAHSDVVGSSTAATIQADAPGPNSTAAAQSGTTALGDSPDASNGEEAPDENSNPATAVPPS